MVPLDYVQPQYTPLVWPSKDKKAALPVMMEARPGGEEGDRSVLEGSGPDLVTHMNWRLAIQMAKGRLLTKVEKGCRLVTPARPSAPRRAFHRCPRIAQTLNVPRTVRFEFSLAAAAWNRKLARWLGLAERPF